MGWKDPKSSDEISELHDPHLRPERGDGQLHDRMPVILADYDWSKWLGEEPTTEEELLAMLKRVSRQSVEGLGPCTLRLSGT